MVKRVARMAYIILSVYISSSVTDLLSVRHMNELFSIHHHISLVGEAWRFLHQVRVACDNQRNLIDASLTEHRLSKLFRLLAVCFSLEFSVVT